MKQKISNLLRGKLFQGAGVLLLSTIFSQLIMVIISPILTRLYTPLEYSYLVIFNSIVSYFATVSTLRYEYAILVPKEKEEASNILLLSLLVAVGVSAVSIFVVFGLSFLMEDFGNFLYLCPLVILAFGIQQSYANWFNREEKYKNIALGNVGRSLGSVTSQLLLSMHSIGLVIGRTIGVLTASFLLFTLFKREYKLPKFNKQVLKDLINKHKKFPIYNAPQAFVNKSAVELPIIFLAIYYNSETIAFYGLATKILLAPLTLISTAISRPSIPKILAFEEYKQVKRFLLRMQALCFVLFLPLVLLIFFFAEPLFEWAFGPGWGITGTYARILLPFFLFRFMGSPIAILGSLIGYQERMLALSVVRVIGVFLSLFLGGIYFGVETTLLIFSLFGAVYWIFSIFHTFYLFKLKLNG